MLIIKASYLTATRLCLIKTAALVSIATTTLYVSMVTYLQVLGLSQIQRQHFVRDGDVLVQYRFMSLQDSNFSRDSRRMLKNIDIRRGDETIHSPDELLWSRRRDTSYTDSRLLHETAYARNNVAKCRPRRNFVFIKCMKCATETMETILRRYGYMRNLSFVVPTGKNIYLGWPFKMTARDYRPKKRNFNILTEHAVYDREMMKALMPRDAAFITIIREPYSHFQSVFYYFNVVNVAKVVGTDPTSEFLRNVHRYDAIYRSHEAAPLRICIPDGFSITRNLQSHCLGVPLGFPLGTANVTNNIDTVTAYLRSLENDFVLVMLVEYFLESLVLLKRLMCWSTRDIIYKTANINYYADKVRKAPRLNVEAYRQWSFLDHLVYDHFHAVFWKKVNEQSSDFFDEVDAFRLTQTRVTIYCRNNRTIDDLVITSTPWDVGFNFTQYECDLMNRYLLDPIKQNYESL